MVVRPFSVYSEYDIIYSLSRNGYFFDVPSLFDCAVFYSRYHDLSRWRQKVRIHVKVTFAPAGWMAELKCA